ncbi:MAG: response regulator [Bacteroidales bacterium]|nr:response regulator [Bacteroidales bacterium]
MKFENITNKDGLSHNTVRYIMQDSRGFMWFSTINGLNQYDGHKLISLQPGFETNSLSENNIRRTIEDRNGHIWVQTTSRFIHCYDTNVESFIDFTQKNEVKQFNRIEILPNGNVWLWGGDKDGACLIQYDRENTSSSTLFNINTIGTNQVNFVYKDNTNQTWIGTDKGLIQIIDNIPRFCNTNNIHHDYHSVIEVEDKNFFFTNKNEVIIYDKIQKTFLPIVNMRLKQDIKINTFAKLDEHLILVASQQQSLLLDTKTIQFTDAKKVFNGESLKDVKLLKDNKKNIWAYNKSGNLWEYDKNAKQFKKHHLIPEHILSLIDLERYNVYKDSRGITWITTYGNGLFAIEQTGDLNHFTTTNSELKTNNLLHITEDRDGNIWVGTENTGLLKIQLTKYDHQIFYPNPQRTNLNDKIIRSIYEEKSTGNLWIGTKEGNVYLYNKDFELKNKFSLNKGVPYCMSLDSLNNMWIGTKGNGIIIIQKKNPKNRLKSYSLSNDYNSTSNYIYSILRDNRNRTWIGTLGSGIFLCELINGDLVKTTFPALTDKQMQIRCMIQDSSGLIWAGGSNGIITFHPDSIIQEKNTVRRFHFDHRNKHSLNNNIVKTIIEDSKQRIWIGTSGGGVNLAYNNKETNQINFRHYTMKDGLISNMVQAILEDNNHNLWISTENGISKFNSEINSFENYSLQDSWESDMFCESSAYKRGNGDLLFGSFNGMYIFTPSIHKKHHQTQDITLTGLAINGIPVKPNKDDSPLKESISNTKTLVLKYAQNSFSIEFSSLYFQDSFENSYVYILESYDTEWNSIVKHNVATYKNIPPGKYTFKVKAMNNFHFKNNTETQLKIIITPPFWRSHQAFLLYFILFLLAVFFISKIIIKMNKLHNDIIIEKQLTDYKLRFFTNISHEFRTPLTIIQGSIENMNNMSLPKTLNKHIKILEKSASKLLRLIDQLLEFRKIQKNQMKLQLEHIEVVQFMKEIYEMFQDIAAKKEINYTFSSNKESNIILIDQNKIDKILFNLLSNAFKHTPPNGNIALELIFDDKNEEFIFKVSDSGIGIPAEKSDQLFIRFNQINYSASGIGIGLNLSSELALAHKGKIEYKQSEWGGASFILTLSSSELTYNKEDIISSEPNLRTKETKKNIIIDDLFIGEREPTHTNSITKKYKILLIEDDEDVRSFLEEQLDKYFTISLATDGLEGWNIATKENFDLIICDVMMPKMDGYEITEKLKTDLETSHIPIILLTAHSSIEHRLEGINVGADSYITKPFSTKYLISRIIKLIEQREKLQYKFAHEPGEIPITITTSNKDNEFISKISKIIENHLDNPDFSIDDFAKEANMGRTLFYKKIKAITNLSPNEYLRIVRLQKAALLLQSTDLNISEIAYKVGFNDPYYFSKCFKEQFKTTPSQFRHKVEKESSNN